MTVTAFDWFSPVHTARRYASEATGAEGDLRDPYERDRARIIHSGAFRRLQGKSQIFAAGCCSVPASRRRSRCCKPQSYKLQNSEDKGSGAGKHSASPPR